jgi:hypothetical protein
MGKAAENLLMQFYSPPSQTTVSQIGIIIRLELVEADFLDRFALH